MSLRERFYSILIVSATDSFTSTFTDLLPETRYYPVLYMMMWVLVLRLTLVPQNCPLYYF